MIRMPQAGTMLHPAAGLRNGPSTTPGLAAGRCGLPYRLASDAALSPSTTWVPPADRLAFQLDQTHATDHFLSRSLSYDSAKSGQHQLHLQTDIRRWHAQQGPRAPIILQAITDDNPATDDDVLIDYAGRSWVVLAQPGT